MLFRLRVVGLCIVGVPRFVRPLMMMCMGCFVGVMWSDDLARLLTLAIHEAIFGCLEASRSCSDVDPLGRLVSVVY